MSRRLRRTRSPWTGSARPAASSTRPRAEGRSALGLDREDLAEPAAVARLPAELRAEEGEDALPGRLRADHPRAEGQDVHVVVLDALVGGIRVVADGGPDAADLVRRDARAHAGAADEDPAVRVPVADRIADLRREVRVVILGVGAVAAQVDQLVAELGRTETPEELGLQGGPGMVGREGD